MAKVTGAIHKLRNALGGLAIVLWYVMEGGGGLAAMLHNAKVYMSWKGPEVGQGMLDFAEDLRYDVVSH